MMNSLYLFNPDSDLALADFTDHYMAPALIRQMADDLASLPLWYAGPGSGVLAASAYNELFIKDMKLRFGMEVELVTWNELAGHTDCSLSPWGWNPAVRKRFSKMGVTDGCLPSVQDLELMRGWASREWALKLLEGCRDLPQVCGSGCVLESVEACRSYWLDQEGRCIFKAPWSGSGKGLLWCYSDFSDSVARWCAHVLSAQGRLIGMPIYNKVCDFAMEFQGDGQGTMLFSGYSWFDTNAKGAYQGNWLASDARIEKRLTRYVDSASMSLIRNRVQELLAVLYGSYRGYLGVDMMVCRLADGLYAICPCVEVNLRMNMGLVARLFADRYLHPGSEGYFQVEACPAVQALQQVHEADTRAYPLVMAGGKVVEGYLSLIPVTPRSRYRVYIKAFTAKK